MGPGADGVEKRLAMSLDDIIKKSKDKGSAGKPSAGRAGPGQVRTLRWGALGSLKSLAR